MESGAQIRVESLLENPHLVARAGWLRWREWSYGREDLDSFVRVTTEESGSGGGLPLTLVAIDSGGEAVGVVGLGEIDGELNAAERGGRTPWVLGMVVDAAQRELGVGRRLLDGLCEAAGALGYRDVWVATGEEAVGFYANCGWVAVERLRLESTDLLTTILVKSI